MNLKYFQTNTRFFENVPSRKYNNNVYRKTIVVNLKKLGLWRIYITKNLRLKNSQTRDNDPTTHRNLQELKNKAWERSNGKCEMCGSDLQKFKYSECHHILPYHRFPHLRNRMDNVMILCNDCHREIHYLNPFLNIRIMKEKANELGIDLKDYYDY